MFLTKSHIKDQIEFIDNGDEKKCIKNLCDEEKFLFTYNDIPNNNPNPG